MKKETLKSFLQAYAFVLVFALATLLVCMTGCTLDKLKAATRDRVSYVPNIAIAAGEASSLVQPIDNIPSPVTNTHKRAECPTGGWITHGDGHKTRCPSCDPPYAESDGGNDLITLIDTVSKLSASSPEKKCACEDCQCDKSEVLAVIEHPTGRFLKVNLEGKDVWLWQWKDFVPNPNVTPNMAKPTASSTPQRIVSPPVTQQLEYCGPEGCSTTTGRRGLLGRIR